MPSFPSYKERFTSGQFAQLTPEAWRLFWTMQGPLASAVSVMSEDWRATGSEQREPYVQGRTSLASGAVSNTALLHPIASAPLTEPKIGSITVSVDALHMWEYYWLESHEGHADPDNDEHAGCVFGRLPADYEGDEGDPGSEEELLRCCGEDRPMKKWQLTVGPADAEAGFVTVHDYVSALHPWLLSLRGEIIRADNVWDSNPPEYYEKMMVEHAEPESLMVLDEARYVAGMRSGEQNQQLHRGTVQTQAQIRVNGETPQMPAPGATPLEQLVARAESGDLEAAQQAIFQATIQGVPHGLRPETVQALQDSHERTLVAEYEQRDQEIYEWNKRLYPDVSTEELEEYMAKVRERSRAAMESRRAELRKIGRP
ncbi:hypothetical protein PG984_015792 [Apiospora sp. TS-2023a]